MPSDGELFDAVVVADKTKKLQKAMKSRFHSKRIISTAVFNAFSIIKETDLLPKRGKNDELRYTVQQGLRAACNTREDVAATLLIQHDILISLSAELST